MKTVTSSFDLCK